MSAAEGAYYMVAVPMIAPNALGDARLVAAAQADPNAFADLYDRYYPIIYRFAQRHTGDAALAEDVTAETFLAALKALPNYQWRGIPFSAWLYRIASTVIAGQHRRTRGVSHIPLDNPLFPLLEPACDEPGPEGCLEEREQRAYQRRLLRQALMRLTADQRRAIALRYAGPDLLPLADIAVQMARSEGAVKLLLHRAVAALRRAMIELERAEVPHGTLLN
jgi:RNA polymerase sigma-70 factor (ECF subfamily)